MSFTFGLAIILGFQTIALAGFEDLNEFEVEDIKLDCAMALTQSQFNNHDELLSFLQDFIFFNTEPPYESVMAEIEVSMMRIIGGIRKEELELFQRTIMHQTKIPVVKWKAAFKNNAHLFGPLVKAWAQKVVLLTPQQKENLKVDEMLFSKFLPLNSI